MSALAPGQRFGTYVVEACVGEGGMGAVYRARDTKLGRRVALKVIRVGPSDGSTPDTRPAAETIARFLGEARLAASLAHPSIVVVYEAGAVHDCPFLVMEWLDGTPLSALIERATLTIAERLEILDAIADALAHAHAQGVIHRDVKPSNVMIDARGRAKLVDFGIAKRTRPVAEPGTMMVATNQRAMLGTPAYMAPEQMLSPAVDARADQFSWAVMAYELLGGVHPRNAVPEGGPAFPVAKAPPLGWIRPDVPDALAAVIHRSMGYEPGSRFTSMDEALYAWRAARGVSSGPGGPAFTSSTSSGASPGFGFSSFSTSPTAGGATGASATGGSSGSSYRSSLPTAPPMAQPMPMAMAMPPMPMPMHAGTMPPQVAPRRFPWIAVLAVAITLLAGSGLVLALVLSGRGSVAGLASPAGSSGAGPSLLPISLGPRKAFIESGLDDLKLVAPAPEVAKVKADLEVKLTPCFDARVPKERSFRAEILVAPDGKVSKVTELNVCQEQHPSFYLCTEFGQTPKKGYPTAPPEVFGCMKKVLEATKLPRLKFAPGDTVEPQEADLHIELR